MEHDIPEDTLSVRGNVKALLSSVPMFDALSVTALDSIAAEIEWLSLPGGTTLFEAGDVSDAMFVLLSGCLGTYAPHSSDRRRFLSRVMAGETVGEMGLISGKPRTATVIALRDSEVGRLPLEAFNRIVRSYPDAMYRIAQLTVQRLEASTATTRPRQQGPRTFTLVPQSIDVDSASFAIELVNALRTQGRAELVWSVRGADHSSHWFHKVESANDFVVYVADCTPTTWSKLCIRQADALLLLTRAENPVGQWAALQGTREERVAARRAELILLNDDGIQPGAAARWLAANPGLPHHHVTNAPDIQRVVRLLTGTAVGVVLSGGGARGFAHIGVVRALREAGIPIDLVGGTSIGSIMGAAVAKGWSNEEMIKVFRRTFVDTNPLGDYTLPVVSIVSGRRVSERLRREFGSDDIEDLPLPFYCVSANLTSGKAEVHTRGTLWRWLRASVAIPGVLPPVVFNGQVLVDGGTMNNLPIDVMRHLGRGAIIGVDIGADPQFTSSGDSDDVPPFWRVGRWLSTWRRRPTLLKILLRAGMVSSSAASTAHREQTDLLVVPPLDGIDMLNWKSFDAAIVAGYAYSVALLGRLSPELRARLHCGAFPDPRSLQLTAARVSGSPVPRHDEPVHSGAIPIR